MGVSLNQSHHASPTTLPPRPRLHTLHAAGECGRKCEGNLTLFLDLLRTVDEAILTVNQEPALSVLHAGRFLFWCVVITVIGIGSD